MMDREAKVILAVMGGILLGLGITLLSFLFGFTIYLLLAIVLMILLTAVGGIFYLGRVSREAWRDRLHRRRI